LTGGCSTVHSSRQRCAKVSTPSSSLGPDVFGRNGTRGFSIGLAVHPLSLLPCWRKRSTVGRRWGTATAPRWGRPWKPGDLCRPS
jgi:hypothetical protein